MVLSDPSFLLTAREAQSVTALVNEAIDEGWRETEDNVLRCCEKIVEVEGVGACEASDV